MLDPQKCMILLGTVLQVVLVDICGADIQGECSRTEYERCVRIADPLVREAHLVFPDNVDDIDLVCRTWNKFVDCIKKYTDKCFTDQQKRQFNKAVENPIESIHQMCMQPHYQKEYLRYAPCIKSTITDRTHCGPQYSFLVDQVEQGNVISKSTLCCSHDSFKECVQRETRKLCDRGLSNGPAAKFSNQIMEKALSFLQEQCYNYIPNSGDCNTLTTTGSSMNLLYNSQTSSEVYPWSTLQDISSKEISPSRVTLTRVTPVSWLPSSTLQQQSNSAPQESSMLGSRTRPASYGRSNSWSDTLTTIQNTPGVDTAQVYSEPSSTHSSKPDWATVTPYGKAQTTGHQGSSSSVYSSQPLPATATQPPTPTAWYPAAGYQTVNEVDEPNQQGLSKPRNRAATKKLFSLTVIATVLTAFC